MEPDPSQPPGSNHDGGSRPPRHFGHTLLRWKQIIIELMSSTFNPRAVLARAISRLQDRLDAFAKAKDMERLTLLAKGRESSPKSIHKKLNGITHIDSDGDVMMRPDILRWMRKHSQTGERVSKHVHR